MRRGRRDNIVDGFVDEDVWGLGYVEGGSERGVGEEGGADGGDGEVGLGVRVVDVEVGEGGR